MKKSMIKAVALVSVLVGSGLQAAGVSFYNDSDRLIRVEGAWGIMYPIQPGTCREFQSGLQDTITIKNRDSEADKLHGAYNYRVKRSVRNELSAQGRPKARVLLKKAYFDGTNLKVEGRIGGDADTTMFMIMREPVKTKHTRNNK